MNRKFKLGIVILLVLISLVLTSCGETKSSISKIGKEAKIVNEAAKNAIEDMKGVQEKLNPLSTKEPSEMALGVDDFPEDWFMVSRAERVKSDVSDEGLKMGWKKGYMIQIGWRDQNNPFITSGIEQYISVYPIENIAKMLKSESSDDTLYEELSDPNIGDGSVAYKITVKSNEEDEIYYKIVFYKKDVLMSLYLSGVIQDFELLKEIAKKAERKIE